MYIKNNRLYDNGVSFDLPKDVRINFGYEDEIVFFRDEAFWCITAYPNLGLFDDKNLGRRVAELYENYKINSLWTEEKTINGVFMRQISYIKADTPDVLTSCYYLNNRTESDGSHHCWLYINIYGYDASSDRNIEAHPVIGAFINSVQNEPREEWRNLPSCVIEMNESRRKHSIEER